MLLDLAFPRRCPVCDRPVKPSNAYICSECRDKLVYIKEPRCRKCGKQLEKAENEYCYDCGSKRHIYDRGAALYSYGSIRLSLYRLKYGGRQEYAVFLGQDMAGRLGREILSWKPDALVPVPLHPAREKKEGIPGGSAGGRTGETAGYPGSYGLRGKNPEYKAAEGAGGYKASK